LGAIGAGIRAGASGNIAPFESAVANIELGDATAGFQTLDTATTTGFQQVSQAGLVNRAGATTAETMTGEVELADLGQAQANEFAGELGIDEATGLMEITPIAESGALEIAGEGVLAGAETAGAVAGGVTAGAIGTAGAIAMGAGATVGALAYLASNGLFDFQAQANAFQKGAYNTQQEVVTRTPPVREYVAPPPMFGDPAGTMDFFRRQNEAEARYQQALTAYNQAISPQSGGPGP
jgi:hypothetical protein